MSAQQYRLLIDHFTKKMVMRFTGNDGCKVSSRVYAFFFLKQQKTFLGQVSKSTGIIFWKNNKGH